MTDECKHGSLRRSCEVCERDAEIERFRAEVERLESTCPLCGHEWRRHDPADGRCDAGPPCDCGRDLTFMANRIKELSCRALDGEEKYPCVDCGVLRTKAEGGTTFTVCDECWDKRRALDGEE